jgi:hypothetical protein
MACSGTALLCFCLITDWMTGDRSPAEVEDFSLASCVQTGSETGPFRKLLAREPFEYAGLLLYI